MKRRLTKLVVFLLFGAIVNVAVAWGCALARIRSEPVYFTHSPERSPDGREAMNFYLMYLPDVRGSGGRTPPDVQRLVCFGYNARSVRWWNSLDSGASVQIDAGWPVTCMTGGMWERWTGGGLSGTKLVLIQRSYVESIAVDGEESLYTEGFPRLLPLTPQHTGFAINTVFYAAVLWLLSLAPFTLRRVIRRRRGHCLKCGYDLRGTSGGEVCPECGAELPLSKRLLP
ncbi:MAG: hypothetical protein V3T84_08345 [Phycisphaerales bacterium]